MWVFLVISFGVLIWGLGIMFYVLIVLGDFVFGYDGVNELVINSMFCINFDNNDVIIVFSNGGEYIVLKFGYEWMFW